MKYRYRWTAQRHDRRAVWELFLINGNPNCHKDECLYSQTVGFLCLGQYWKEKPEYILYTNAYDSVSTAKTRTCNASESLTVAIRIRCRPYTSVNGRQTRSNRATCYMFIPERFFNTYRTRNAHVLMEPRLNTAEKPRCICSVAARSGWHTLQERSTQNTRLDESTWGKLAWQIYACDGRYASICKASCFNSGISFLWLNTEWTSMK